MTFFLKNIGVDNSYIIIYDYGYKNNRRFKVDEYAIKYIAGHKIKDLTERVYTDRDLEWLAEELEKIK